MSPEVKNFLSFYCKMCPIWGIGILTVFVGVRFAKHYWSLLFGKMLVCKLFMLELHPGLLGLKVLNLLCLFLSVFRSSMCTNNTSFRSFWCHLDWAGGGGGGGGNTTKITVNW